MPIVQLPDGSEKTFNHPVTVQEVAESIGSGLAKAAIAAKVNGRMVDTDFTINTDVGLSILTDKDVEGLEVIRHSTAHLLAHAVKQLFPDAQVTIGPVIEDGFYYDFSYPPGFHLDDLEKIEQRMEALAKENFAVSHREVSRDEAIQFFRDQGEEYKAKIIEDIPEDETLTLYQQDNFIDLCRGPHVPSTGKLKAFKLTKLAGAYWRGDSNNEMLQRIYGTAWPDKKQLKAYLHRLEEAEKRDHRKLAKKMDLFHIQEEAPGMIFWHPRGWALYSIVLDYIAARTREWGYQEIRTPQIVDLRLWQQSGHAAKFSEEMFYFESHPHTYAVKPMSCPCHVQVYNQGIKSYRDLPLRMSEFGNCHRNEPSGTLHGLMRLRNFTQDDAHIFCTEDQIQTEVSAFIDQILQVYTDFGFNDVLMKLSTRPENRVGEDAVWDKAEAALEDALNAKGVKWELNPGEGAFYGPKIEFSLSDCIGRVWQCGTMQVDFVMPGRLGANYIAEDGSKHTPVMLHRAMLGSVERFLGILLEESAGVLPLWLAPVQAVIMNITESQENFVNELANRFSEEGLRVITDVRNEKINFKIREHTIQRVPYIMVVGEREMADGSVALRNQAGINLGSYTIDDLIAKFKKAIAERSTDDHIEE